MNDIVKRLLKSFLFNVKSFIALIVWFVRTMISCGFSHMDKVTCIGKRAVVLANGPSLKEVLSEFKREEYEDVLVVNFFCNSPYFEIIKPRYYCLMDPGFWGNIVNNDELSVMVKETIRKLQSVTWNMVLIVPKSATKTIEKLFLGTKISVVSLPAFEYKGWSCVEYYLFKHRLSRVPCGNVLVGALVFLLQRRYSSIQIYGADHSWFSSMAVNEQSQLCLIDPHFYDDKEQEMKPWLGIDGKVLKISELITAWSLVFSSYDKLREYSDAMNIQIINKTKNSFIDSFKKG